MEWGYSPWAVPEPNSGFVALAAGRYHSLGLKSNGSIVAWGSNDNGQCDVPEPNSGFVAVAAGSVHSLGLKSDGSIVAWGGNDDGQCDVPSPNSGFVAVAAGTVHSLGLKLDYWNGPPFVTIAEAKLLPDDSEVGISGAAVSAAWPNFFYIQSDNRSCGIRVEKSSHGLAANERAYVGGVVKTNADRERYIAATSAWWTATGNVWPLGMPNKSVGGGDWFYDEPTGAGQEGITGASGLNNIGLLVTTWGEVTATSRDWFYVDDGSAVTDGTVYLGVYVDAPGLVPPDQGVHVAVTGISSCDFYAGNQVNVLLPRTQDDIVVLP